MRGEGREIVSNSTRGQKRRINEIEDESCSSFKESIIIINIPSMATVTTIPFLGHG